MKSRAVMNEIGARANIKTAVNFCFKLLKKMKRFGPQE